MNSSRLGRGAVGSHGSAMVAVRPRDHNLMEGAKAPLWSGR